MHRLKQHQITSYSMTKFVVIGIFMRNDDYFCSGEI